MLKLILVVVVAALCFSCRDQPSSTGQLLAGSGMVDITVRGRRLYGLHANYADKTGKIVVSSSVVLMPWNERPNTHVQVEGDVTIVTIKGVPYRHRGRFACEVDGRGEKLTHYPGQISIEAYQDRSTLERVLTEIMTTSEPKLLQ